jgi:hypothetical protein
LQLPEPGPHPVAAAQPNRSVIGLAVHAADFRLHRPANQPQDGAGGTAMADTSLWPVVVGGLLTGFFALGEIGVGLVGTARRDAAQERREKTQRRADKFEELVAAVYEFDDWLEGLTDREAFGRENIPIAASPFAKVQSILSVYFPQFNHQVIELASAADLYRDWIYAAKKRSTNTWPIQPRASTMHSGPMQRNAKHYSPP